MNIYNSKLKKFTKKLKDVIEVSFFVSNKKKYDINECPEKMQKN